MLRCARWVGVAAFVLGSLFATCAESRAQGRQAGNGRVGGRGFGFGFGRGGLPALPGFGPPVFIMFPPAPLPPPPSPGFFWMAGSIDSSGSMRMRAQMGTTPSKGRRIAGPLPPAELARVHNLPASEPEESAARKASAVKNATEIARSKQLVTYGDRLFRGANLKRAEDRYEQALKTTPDAVEPRIRLAQVAICRGLYTDAARFLREAIAVDPDWLTKAPDIRVIYGEPEDFNKQVARLESHLQTNPSDRDAWVVLGAQLYLSDQPRRAADVFLRLSDRKPDPALAALIDAATPHRVGE